MTGSLQAYRSLAKAAGVDLSTVLAHARNNTLKALVEARGGPAERKRDEQHVARINALYRSKLLGILQERDALLREREQL